MIRRVAGSVLIFEAIVIVLAIPVAVQVEGVDAVRGLVVGLGLALAALVVSARVDRPWGVPAGWVIQGLVLACALVVPMLLIPGAMFAGLWYAAIRMVAIMEARPAEGSGAATTEER